MKALVLALIVLLAASCSSHQEKWMLVWEDNFDQQEFDTLVWSKIPRGKPDWAKKMSDNDACYDMRDGNLILRGIINHDLDADTSRYLTGGLYTKGKMAFHGGRLEIRAKLESATGAWPAIWMKPYEEHLFPWPSGGEIDIMEHLNHDTIAYQTVHTTYTHTLRMSKNPPNGSTGAIIPDDYNVYAVEMNADSLVFFINDQRTFAYPRIETELEGQYPFDKPYYLLIDMQLGGNWVGDIDPSELPVEMAIDWVRYYLPAEHKE